MAMDIILHIGMHKNGTTSLQNLLTENVTQLAAQRCGIMINPPQINVKRPDKFDPGWFEHRLKVYENESFTKLVISAEVVSTFDLPQMSRVVDIFKGHPVTLVCCFRHWVSFLPSRYAADARLVPTDLLYVICVVFFFHCRARSTSRIARETATLEQTTLSPTATTKRTNVSMRESS